MSSSDNTVDAIMETLSGKMDQEFPDWAVLVDPPPLSDWLFFRHWIDQGFHAGLDYLERTAQRRRSLSEGYPGYRTLVLGLLPYDPRAFHPPSGPSDAEIARYAVGEDYHIRFEQAFTRVLAPLKKTLPPDENPLVKPDHGALLEKSLAQLAGLGRMGKNTLLIHSGLGSWMTIGGLLLKTPLKERRGRSKMGDPCSQCTRCLDHCPTTAFRAPYTLDAGRCLSYLTIERPDDSGSSLRKTHGENWLFGCDRCQEVCPHNARVQSPKADPGAGRFVPMEEATEESIRRFRKENGALSRVPVRKLLERVEEIRISGYSDHGLYLNDSI